MSMFDECCGNTPGYHCNCNDCQHQRFVAEHLERVLKKPATKPVETFTATEALKEVEALAKSWVWTVPFVGPSDAYIRANADADCADAVLAIIAKVGKPKN